WNSILTIRTAILWPHRRWNAMAAPPKQKRCWRMAWKQPSAPGINMLYQRWRGCWMSWAGRGSEIMKLMTTKSLRFIWGTTLLLALHAWAQQPNEATNAPQEKTPQ